MKKLLVSFLVAFLGFTSMLNAQSTITGKIIDESTNQGVPFVNVGMFRVADTAFVSGAASDDKGTFTLQMVPQGEMLLKISAIGYELFEMPVTVKGDQHLGTLKLKAGTTRLDEVVISEKRPLFAVEGEKTLYNTAEDPSIQTGTLSDALQNAPGVEVDVEGNITLRGTSSVEVWINDKPSHMTAENLKTYIQTLPANSIDRVEVITNPSARYGSKADGIINIVTNAKVQKNEFVSFGLNASTRPSFTPWMSYVWSNEKLTINAYVNGGYSYWKSDRTSDKALSTFDSIAQTYHLANHETSTSNNRGNNYSTGGHVSIDYEIDTANSLNLWLSGWPSWTRSESYYGLNRVEYLDANGLLLPDSLLTQYDGNSNGDNSSTYLMGGLYYQHQFDNKGHNLSVSVNGSGFGDKNKSTSTRQFTLPESHTRVMMRDEKESYYAVEGELVYNRPYSENGEISIGLTSGYTPEYYYLVTDTLADGVMARDDQRSYNALFTSLDNEIFLTVQHKFGGFTVKPGIRLCHELLRGSYADSSQYNFSKPFLSLRPSLHLSYRTKSMHNFNMSYTRRISAPEARQLSLFPLYDEDYYNSGNPDLDRVFTNSFEAGWTKYFMNFGSVGLSVFYHGKTDDVHDVQLSVYHPLYGRVVPYSYPVNVGKNRVAGAAYNMMYRPNGFFNLRFNTYLYNSHLETVFNNTPVTQDSWSYSFNMNLWAKLWNRLEVTASGYYSSPTQSLFSERHARYGINAGMRADFFDRKMSVFINAMDIFNWNRWGYSNNSPYVTANTDSKYNSRSVSVGLTFRFGKMELEQKAKQGVDDSQSAPQGMGN